MTPALFELRPWSPGRRWGVVALIFGAQLVLIFWLGETTPIRPRAPAPALTFTLAESAPAALLALNDPTLFALPHRQSLEGRASLGNSPPEFPSFQWPEPTNSLGLAVDRVGATFNQFIETNAFDSLRLPAGPEPDFPLPAPSSELTTAAQSALRLEGDLARRRLVTPLPLRSWPSPEILGDSVVRIAVDAEGTPVSPTLLSSSGAGDADQEALKLARAARFEPLRLDPADTDRDSAADLSWGRMIFRWHTIAQPRTNAPSANH